jgi:ribosomal-protein-alanine N-acetyltransferase
MGTGYGFGIFLRFEEDGMPRERFVGEINLSSIQRGPFQSGHLGYWIDQSYAGRGLIPEAVVVMFRFAFEELGLHRVQVSIIPRNRASRRVAAKLGLRDEGIAVRYLEIDGRWEDHIRYAITAEEWLARRQQYLEQWLTS